MTAAEDDQFCPIMARTWTLYTAVGPRAFDSTRLIVVRSGSSVVFSEFGERPVTVGDAILVGANTLSGYEPEGAVTVTTLDLDRDYVIDQVFWKHAAELADRWQTEDFIAETYVEPAQVLRLGVDRVGLLLPWLDELVKLSRSGPDPARFYRLQALLFAILDVVTPFVRTTMARQSPTQRRSVRPSVPRHRRFAPLRREAYQAAELLRSDPARRWSVTGLADEVHLSKAQIGRVFVQAFGKSPIAYLTMLRTERMAGLLRTTDTSIAVIAREVGWGDPDFAARQFRRSVGVTPSSYRAQSREHHQQMTG